MGAEQSVEASEHSEADKKSKKTTAASAKAANGARKDGGGASGRGKNAKKGASGGGGGARGGGGGGGSPKSNANSGGGGGGTKKSGATSSTRRVERYVDAQAAGKRMDKAMAKDAQRCAQGEAAPSLLRSRVVRGRGLPGDLAQKVALPLGAGAVAGITGSMNPDLAEYVLRKLPSSTLETLVAQLFEDAGTPHSLLARAPKKPSMNRKSMMRFLVKLVHELGLKLLIGSMDKRALETVCDWGAVTRDGSGFGAGASFVDAFGALEEETERDDDADDDDDDEEMAAADDDDDDETAAGGRDDEDDDDEDDDDAEEEEEEEATAEDDDGRPTRRELALALLDAVHTLGTVKWLRQHKDPALLRLLCGALSIPTSDAADKMINDVCIELQWAGLEALFQLFSLKLLRQCCEDIVVHDAKTEKISGVLVRAIILDLQSVKDEVVYENHADFAYEALLRNDATEAEATARRRVSRRAAATVVRGGSGGGGGDYDEFDDYDDYEREDARAAAAAAKKAAAAAAALKRQAAAAAALKRQQQAAAAASAPSAAAVAAAKAWAAAAPDDFDPTKKHAIEFCRSVEELLHFYTLDDMRHYARMRAINANGSKVDVAERILA